MDYRDRITIEPGKRSGKPCVRGLRITVYDVLSYLASGMSTDEVLADFPYLTREDILACLAYPARTADSTGHRPLGVPCPKGQAPDCPPA